MLKRFLIVAVLCGVVFGGLVGFNEIFLPNLFKQIFSQPMPPVTISAAEVTSETWPDSLRAIGTISAVEGVDVAPEVAGIVEEIAFDASERVASGQVLVQLDDAVEQAELQQYEAQMTLAQRTLERTATLRGRGNATGAALDEAQAALDEAEARIAATRAVIDQKRIEAPFDGTIGIPRIDVGQFVNAGDMLVTLQRLDHVHVDFTLPEQSISQVALGQKVELEVDAYPGRTFAGAITGIDPRLSATSRSLSIRATLDNQESLLLPGLFARVSVILPERPEVVTVPQTAVSFSLYGDTVFVVEEAPGNAGAEADGEAIADATEPDTGGANAAGGVEAASADGDAGPQGTEPTEPTLIVSQKFVRVGQRRADIVEILEGLEPGQRVVTSGQLKLQNGFPVVIDNSIDPTEFVLDAS